MKKDELEITTTGNRVQISGKRGTEMEKKTDTIYTYERQYGSFTRMFTLPKARTSSTRGQISRMACSRLSFRN